ncbi:hypothetical protein QUF63_17395 [Anaerolineales bacterium HSG25]|nr:hypothetical protein [Anaerolineales bacterium HSG25]
MSLPIWLQTNAWREIFTRTFEQWQTQTNVYPEWLVNPDTNRRLKLDFLCLTIGMAVRFEGVQRKGQKVARLSLEEEDLKRDRDQARIDQCQKQGFDLLLVDVSTDEIKPVFRQLDMMLSLLGQRLTGPNIKAEIKQARATSAGMGRRVKINSDLKMYADLWQDRQYQIPTAEVKPEQTTTFTAGMDVEHTVFGLGTVVSAEESGGDIVLAIDFLDVGRKTLAASFVVDKLKPL